MTTYVVACSGTISVINNSLALNIVTSTDQVTPGTPDFINRTADGALLPTFASTFRVEGNLQLSNISLVTPASTYQIGLFPSLTFPGQQMTGFVPSRTWILTTGIPLSDFITFFLQSQPVQAGDNPGFTMSLTVNTQSFSGEEGTFNLGMVLL